MKKHFILFIFSLILFDAYAQSNNSCADSTNQTKVYQQISIRKERYTESAILNKIEGTVIINCDIDTKCKLINCSIEKGLGYGLDELALDAIPEIEKQLEISENNICEEKKNIKIPIVFKLPKSLMDR